MSVLPSLAPLLSHLKTGTYTVTRVAPGTTAGGIYTPGSASAFSINASVQPLQAEQLERMPEGTRVDEARAVYTDGDLQTQEETSGRTADLITIEGRSYQVQSVRDFQPSGGLVEALVRRVDPS